LNRVFTLSTLSTFQKSGAKHWIEFSFSTFLKAYSWFEFSISTFLKAYSWFKFLISTFLKAYSWFEFLISTFLKAYSWFCSTFLKSGKGGKNKIDYFFTN
jgi:hypothetical protein